jgi:hypothetical protein
MRLLALVAAAMAADLVTFALVVPLVGIGSESNPAMAAAYLRFGLVVVALLKVVCTVAILLLVARVRRPDLRRLAAGLGVAIAAVGVAGNVGAWLR